MKLVTVQRSPRGYGTHVWLGSRVRIGSRNTMNPDYNGPRISKSADEFCNDVLALRLYPVIAIDIWWRRHQRTAKDGLCDRCKNELRAAGWSESLIESIRSEYDDHS